MRGSGRRRKQNATEDVGVEPLLSLGLLESLLPVGGGEFEQAVLGPARQQAGIRCADPEFLLETWKQMNRRGASGVDGETIREFEADLESRIAEIHAQLRSGGYRPPPVRHVEIPKGDGKTRPLGIPTVADRLVQRAVARILTAIYEPEFLACSYGFRPGKGPHDALRELRKQVIAGKTSQIFTNPRERRTQDYITGRYG